MAEGYKTRQLYDIGQRLASHLDKACGYDVIAKELGVTKQRAHVITMVALAKLACGLQACMREDRPL